MQIIDKYRDYYDWHQFEYGEVDKTATYDRRGSKIITNQDFFDYCHFDEIKYNKFRNLQWHYFLKGCLILFEVGRVQYILDYSGPIKVKYKFNENIKLCRKPVTLIHIRIDIDPFRKKIKDLDNINHIKVQESEYQHAIEDAIWKETPIPSLIDSKEFYNNLENYFRSFYNDKTVEIQNTDLQKLENAGFDKKSSFRHPIK